MRKMHAMDRRYGLPTRRPAAWHAICIAIHIEKRRHDGDKGNPAPAKLLMAAPFDSDSDCNYDYDYDCDCATPGPSPTSRRLRGEAGKGRQCQSHAPHQPPGVRLRLTLGHHDAATLNETPDGAIE